MSCLDVWVLLFGGVGEGVSERLLDRIDAYRRLVLRLS